MPIERSGFHPELHTHDMPRPTPRFWHYHNRGMEYHIHTDGGENRRSPDDAQVTDDKRWQETQ